MLSYLPQYLIVYLQNEVKADFVLKKEKMNIHMFNVTVEDFSHALHIVVLLDESMKDGRPFPISLLLRLVLG